MCVAYGFEKSAATSLSRKDVLFLGLCADLGVRISSSENCRVRVSEVFELF